MSGIFNGDSIYKSGGGGGGGGYKDGGALVDGDLIKVENNSISTYTNTSRADINYYLEVQDGEVLNAVIELTNEYNATVHVYIVQNGLYIPLGNVGGDTVNAGDDYKINIVGNSFMLEVVTPSQAIPEYVELAGEVVKVIKVNNILWACSDLAETEFSHYKIDGICYYEPNKDLNINGWRIPTRSEVVSLNNAYTWQQLRAVSGWPSGYNGNNLSGFNAKPYGNYVGYVQDKNWSHSMLFLDTGNAVRCCYMGGTNQYVFSINASSTVRLVYDL